MIRRDVLFHALFTGILPPAMLKAVRDPGQPAPAVQDTPPDIVLWAERVAGLKLDLWQQRVLLSRARRFLMNCSRQVGKTEVISLKAAYRAKFLRRRVLALAPSLYQSSKIRERAYRYLMAEGQIFTTANATTLELAGGGAVISLPGDRPDLSARSETIDDLIVDEASRIRDSLIAASTPTIATRPDATVTYLSSPAGKRGVFYKAWSDASGDWEKYSIKAVECSRISQDFLRLERESLGSIMFSQEYECQFVADSSAVLDPDAITRMFARPGYPQADKVDWASEPPRHDWSV